MHVRRALAVAALVSVSALAPTVASAAPPSVSLKTCNALGGIYSASQGTKYCITTASGTDVSTVSNTGPVEIGGGGIETWFYIGTTEVSSTYTQQITRTQKNNGLTVTTAGPKVYTSTSYAPTACTITLTAVLLGEPPVTTNRDFSECSDRDLFLA
jgi:hypothetical protein